MLKIVRRQSGLAANMTSYHLDVPFAAPISQGYKGLAKYFYSPSGFIVLQHFFALEEFADFDTFDS